jgi:ketosteroid isomerase-like protein
VHSWLAKKLTSYVMSRTRTGDVGPTLKLDAPDVELTFPGQNSWSGVFRGKHEVERWLRRFAAVGIQIYPDEVVAKGFPWDTTICIRGHDLLRSPDGELIYENRYVIWGHASWGKFKHYEVYEDTHKANQFDDYLSQHRPELAVANLSSSEQPPEHLAHCLDGGAGRHRANVRIDRDLQTHALGSAVRAAIRRVARRLTPPGIARPSTERWSATHR